MPLKSRALNKFNHAWTNNIVNLRRMDHASNVRPQAPDQIFTADEPAPDGTLKIHCGPAALKLAEKAGSNSSIFVGVEGSISINETGQADVPFFTTDFETRVAYFRLKGAEVAHVYGVHYDMDITGAGHPVFHSQFGSMTQLYESVCEHLRVDGHLKDCAGHILRNVRTPTAQMDFFSVFTQLCADHLMQASHPTGQVTRAFKKIRTACDFMLGAAYKIPELNSETAARSYRSVHWYR